MTIPNRCFFVWTGKRIPAFAWLAMRAALSRGGFDQVALHAEPGQLQGDPLVANLLGQPGFVLRDHRDSSLHDLSPAVAKRIAVLESAVDRPASKANLMRLRVLWAEGGVYLDTDCIALQAHQPLLALGGFVGRERVALPSRVVHSKNPLVWAKAGVLLGLRDLASRSPNPQQLFGLVEPLYDLACNNAALGFSSHHPFVAACLETAAALPDAIALARFELGPRLLDRVANSAAGQGTALLAPEAFYPLAPEICAAYVRPDPDGVLGDRPHPNTYAAHLYDSVLIRRLGQPLDASWFATHRGQTLLGRMVEPWLDELAALTSS